MLLVVQVAQFFRLTDCLLVFSSCRLVRLYKVAAERRRRAKQEQELLELVHAGVIEVMCWCWFMCAVYFVYNSYLILLIVAGMCVVGRPC